uniref:Secreted protein n=1 Tax=Physcomitrium patens TaxID=3218 RepID=A0A2K1J904_PHYPA|nr:hypothetical protein PHYPA_021131 [Physcomitrium patens]
MWERGASVAAACHMLSVEVLFLDLVSSVHECRRSSVVCVSCDLCVSVAEESLVALGDCVMRR